MGALDRYMAGLVMANSPDLMDEYLADKRAKQFSEATPDVMGRPSNLPPQDQQGLMTPEQVMSNRGTGLFDDSVSEEEKMMRFNRRAGISDNQDYQKMMINNLQNMNNSVLQNSRSAQADARKFRNAQLTDINTGNDYEQFLKEERAYSSKAVKKFNDDSEAVEQTIKKLQSLSKQAGGKGTTARAARNSMIANIVRLNSPGIVQEKELQIYTGGQSTTQAMIGWLAGNGYDTKAIQAYMDPSGEGFDVEGMLALGNTLAASKAGALVNSYDDAKDRAQRAQISERAFNTNFGGASRSYKKMTELGAPDDDYQKRMKAALER